MSMAELELFVEKDKNGIELLQLIPHSIHIIAPFQPLFQVYKKKKRRRITWNS